MGRHILHLTAMVCAAAAICGCQSSLCPDAQQLADQARLEGLEPQAQLERLTAAIDSYRQCRQTKEKSQEVCQNIDMVLADLTRTYASLMLSEVSRRPSDTIPECDQVIATLERAVSYDDPDGTIRMGLDRYRSKRGQLVARVQDLLTKATEGRSARNWREAVSAVNEALTVNPEAKEAERLRQQVVQERDDHYARAIRELCVDATFEKCREADALLRTFGAEEPRPDKDTIDDLRDLIDSAKRQVAKQLIAEKKYFSAFTLLKEADVPKNADLLKSVIDQGGVFYMTLANEEYRNVREFHAYAAAVKALAMLGDTHETAFKLHRDCADRVDDSIQARIGIAAFESSGDEPDIGKMLANEVLTYLHSRLPYGIGFEEREKMEFAIEKVGSAETVRLLALKQAVFGDVQCKVQREHDARQVTVWVPVLKTIPNPHYETELKAIRDAGKHRDELPEPKPTITAKVSEKIEYTMGEDRLHGQATCSARIYSGSDAEVTSPKSFSITREAKDTFRDAVPDANIAVDPLEMPSQLAFLQGIREELTKQVGDWLIAQLENRQRQFCQETDHHIQRKDWDQATRTAVQGYFYCLRAQVPQDDPSFVRLRRLALFDLTEGPVRAELIEPSQQ